MVRHDGALFIGTLTPFPIVPGAAQVFKVDPGSGRFSVFADKLTNVLGLAFDEEGALYVLESSAGAGFPTPGRGQVVRIMGDERSTVVTGLSLPTAMTLGPDGNLYVSNKGFGEPGNTAGEVVRISFDGGKDEGDNH
jgi:sugar lactone lactonase YvrE